MYNESLDELELAAAARLRRRVRQRAPPERLRDDALAQPDGSGAGAADQGRRTLHSRQLDRALQPADASRRGAVQCSIVLSGGRVIAGFPVGTPMDTACTPADRIPARCASVNREAHDLITRAWHDRSVFASQRLLLPLPLRENPVPRTAAAAATRPIGSGRAAPSRRGSGAAEMDYVYCYLGTMASKRPPRRWTASGRSCGESANH